MDRSTVSGDEAPSASVVEKSMAPAERSGTVLTRRYIIFAFWVIIGCLGLPLWLWTTSIHRASLPLESMNRWAEGKACQVHYPLNVEVYAKDMSSGAAASLAKQTQDLLAGASQSDLYSFRVTAGVASGIISRSKDSHLRINLATSKGFRTQSKLMAWDSVLDVDAGAEHAKNSESMAAFVAGQITNVFDPEYASTTRLLSKSAFRNDKKKSLEPKVKATLDARTTRAFKYASNYHLTFSLFSATSSPASWDIEKAIDRYMSPLIIRLSAISNITVDTQVQLHAALSSSIAGPTFDPTTGQWRLNKADLSGFINAAEWPLNPSIGSGPTINFVLYVPGASQSPLVIAETGGNSWLVPQWGSVQILNSQLISLSAQDLEPVMLTFANQLTSLLGLPEQPASLALRISSLARERATSLILSASSTLGALSRLTLKLTSIAIPESVATSVANTISHLEQACNGLREGRFDDALAHARIANDEAERAFFEPSMVGQVYFPDEHKVAVYVPLLGPMAVPLVMAAAKEVRKLRGGKVKTV